MLLTTSARGSLGLCGIRREQRWVLTQHLQYGFLQEALHVSRGGLDSAPRGGLGYCISLSSHGFDGIKEVFSGVSCSADSSMWVDLSQRGYCACATLPRSQACTASSPRPNKHRSVGSPWLLTLSKLRLNRIYCGMIVVVIVWNTSISLRVCWYPWSEMN